MSSRSIYNNNVMSILLDREGHLWFGTSGDGVSRYDGQSFVTFTTADGLANNNVMSIMEDGESHLWFGTYGGGVSRYAKSNGGLRQKTAERSEHALRLSGEFGYQEPTTFSRGEFLSIQSIFVAVNTKRFARLKRAGTFKSQHYLAIRQHNFGG